jgi:hypothetical protein
MRRDRNVTLSSYMQLSFLSPCHGSTALVDLGLLYEVPRLDTHTHAHIHSVGLRWTSDRPVQGTISNNTQHKRQTSPAGFETANPSKRAAVDPRLISRGQCLAYTVFVS